MGEVEVAARRVGRTVLLTSTVLTVVGIRSVTVAAGRGVRDGLDVCVTVCLVLDGLTVGG